MESIKPVNKDYLYVLDYCTNRIMRIVVYNSNSDKDINKILEFYGLKEDQCSYMWSSDKLELEEQVIILTK